MTGHFMFILCSYTDLVGCWWSLRGQETGSQRAQERLRRSPLREMLPTAYGRAGLRAVRSEQATTGEVERRMRGTRGQALSQQPMYQPVLGTKTAGSSLARINTEGISFRSGIALTTGMGNNWRPDFCVSR